MRDLPDLDENHTLVKVGDGFVIHVEYSDGGWMNIPLAFDGPEHWRQWCMRNARELCATIEIADRVVAKLEKTGPLDEGES